MPLHFEEMDSETCALVESFLPATATEFARLIGLEKALALVGAYGGIELLFPKQKDGPGAANFARLAEVIGDAAVRRLAAEYSNEIVYIPRCMRAMNALRHRQIIVEYTALIGKTSARQAANELAVRFRTTSRSIENIVNGKAHKSRSGKSTEGNR